jgi:RNA polymerase sigma-70 factor, ECF subfamily
MNPGHDVTELLRQVSRGDAAALSHLLPLVYADLQRVAQRALGREHEAHTLSSTALVHEAYLRMVDQRRVQWNDRAHFLAVAATAMRRVLVDHARRQKRLKRGGARQQVTLDDAMLLAAERADALVELDDALVRLGQLNGRLARVVECRFFAGLTTEETAQALAVTTRTVERDWQKARAWLFIQLQDGTG